MKYIKTNFRIVIECVFIMLIISATGKLKAQEMKAETIFEKYENAIVVIYSFDFNGDLLGQGSGVILSEKGILLTNFHIFSGGERMIIRNKEDTIPYLDVIGVDVEKDILIVKIGKTELPDIPVTNSDEIKVGETIYAIGSPLGLENTITTGIVSGIRNKLGDKERSMIQISASLSPGSSGGAVFNSMGQLIGISNSGFRGAQNLNFAIPINEYENVTLGSYSDKTKLEALNYFYMAKQLFETGKNEDAIEYYTKFLAIFPDDHLGYNYRGLAYFERKQYKEAITDYNRSIVIDPDYAPAYSNRGDAHFRMEQFKKAINDYTKVIKMFPDYIEAYYSRGVVYISEEDWGDAIDDFTVVIKKDPENVNAFVNRGICYFYRKRYEHAISDWKTAIKKKPSLKSDLQRWIDQADVLWQYNIR